jgi:hypothetical protein
MKWIVSLILSLAACGLVFLGAVDDQPLVAPRPSPTEPTESPSQPFAMSHPCVDRGVLAASCSDNLFTKPLLARSALCSRRA